MPTNPTALQRQVRFYESLIELAAVLQHQSDFQETVRVITERARELFHVDHVAVMMVNPRTHETIKTLFRTDGNRPSPQLHDVHTMLTGWVLHHRQPFVTEHLTNDARITGLDIDDAKAVQVCCLPFFMENTVIGTLLLFDRSRHRAFTEDVVAAVQEFVTISTPYLQNMQKIQEYFTQPMPEQTLITKYEDYGLYGRSAHYLELLRAVEAAAKTDVRVILEGASGTGKELIARALHAASRRADQHFIAVDCSTIPDHLIESELFGHVRGTFTGATQDRTGLFEAADKGILFLDEIANLSQKIQAKLLRVLQESSIRPLGSNKSHDIDVRVIAASNVSLRQLVDRQQFRADLFYRLHVYPIRVPSLQERRTDIPVLASHFLQKFSTAQGKQVDSIGDTLLQFLTNRSWDGNIRELENLIEQMVTRAPSTTQILDRSFLPPELREEDDPPHSSPPPSLNTKLAEYETQLILEALRTHDWNQSEAARSLDIAESSLRTKMQRLGIVKPDQRREEQTTNDR